MFISLLYKNRRYYEEIYIFVAGVEDQKARSIGEEELNLGSDMWNTVHILLSLILCYMSLNPSCMQVTPTVRW